MRKLPLKDHIQVQPRLQMMNTLIYPKTRRYMRFFNFYNGDDRLDEDVHDGTNNKNWQWE